MKIRVLVIILIVGIAIGIAGALYLPDRVRPLLPAAIGGKQTPVEGTVVAKQRKDRSLLLTVSTEQGAVLVTVTRKVDEVDLLVGTGDKLEFRLKRYEPFVNDPAITRVVKAGGTAGAGPATVPAAPAGEETKREAPKPKQKTAPKLPQDAAAPAATDAKPAPAAPDKQP